MSYKKLEIWRLAKELVVDIHRMTIEKLPKFEMYEEGSQIRRSIISQINHCRGLATVEGHISRNS